MNQKPFSEATQQRLRRDIKAMFEDWETTRLKYRAATIRAKRRMLAGLDTFLAAVEGFLLAGAFALWALAINLLYLSYRG